MLSFLKPIIDSAANGLNSLFTNDEERIKAEAELLKLQVDLEKSINEHVTEVVKAQKETLLVELNSSSYLVKNWRPIMMLLFCCVIGYNYLVLPFILLVVTLFNLNIYPPQTMNIPNEMWSLLQIGIGGYIIGRSGEKMMSSWKDRK